MRRRLVVVALCFALPGVALGQGGEAPAGAREGVVPRGLSAEQVRGYLAGEGMGMARVAELSHYPGPRHVLDLAEDLQLSGEQRNAVQEVFGRMHQEAVRLGMDVVAKEWALDRLFSTPRGESSAPGVGEASLPKVEEASLRPLVEEIARLHDELRWVHLRAHLETRRLLSPSQVDRYDALRGYETEAMPGGGSPVAPGAKPDSLDPAEGAAQDTVPREVLKGGTVGVRKMTEEFLIGSALGMAAFLSLEPDPDYVPFWFGVSTLPAAGGVAVFNLARRGRVPSSGDRPSAGGIR